MTEIRRSIRMFGDPAEVAIDIQAGKVVGLRPVRGNDRCQKLIGAVGKQLAAGRTLHEQYGNLCSLQDLISALLDQQDAKA